MKKLWLVFIGIVLVAGTIWALNIFSNKKEKIETPPTPAPVNEIVKTGIVVIPPDSPKLEQLKVESVQTADLPTDEVTVPGRIETNPNKISRVALPVVGRIASVMVKIGDIVKVGQPIITIDSPDADTAMSAYLQAESGIQQAQAMVTRSGADLAKAQADLDRVSDLYQHNAIAQKEVLNAENILAQAKASLEVANAGLAQARVLRDQSLHHLELLGLSGEKFGQKLIVHAPISGKVMDLSIVAGEYRNDITTPIMTIADLSSVVVSSDVPESYIRLIQLGDHIDINLVAYPDETFSGRVTRIVDTVDPQARTIKVLAELNNSQGRFRAEMFGTIRLTKATHLIAVLPSGAVIQGEGHNFVFVEQEQGHFKQTEVTTGQPVKDLLPILSGVNPGERVVVEGTMLLKNE